MAVAVFTGLETSIYCTVALSLALLLIRLARTKGRFLGRVQISRFVLESDVTTTQGVDTLSSTPIGGTLQPRDAFLAIDREDASNPAINIETPYPGVFIFRFSEGFNYLNQAQQMDSLVRHVRTSTRPSSTDDGIRPHDRLWCDVLLTQTAAKAQAHKPLLRAVVLDCSSVNNIDITSLQGLVDARNAFAKHAAPGVVQWHFAYVNNRWTRRALATAGFGCPTMPGESSRPWAPVYTVSRGLCGDATDMSQHDDRGRLPKDVEANYEKECKSSTSTDGDKAQAQPSEVEVQGISNRPVVELAATTTARLVFGMDRPFFHVDLVEAVDAAVRDAKSID